MYCTTPTKVAECRKRVKRVWKLKEEIAMFFEMKEIVCNFSTKTQNIQNGCLILRLLQILGKKMNELNKKLQGKEVFAHDLYLEVKSFQTKLTLFAKQMSNENFAHFPLLKRQIC